MTDEEHFRQQLETQFGDYFPIPHMQEFETQGLWCRVEGEPSEFGQPTHGVFVEGLHGECEIADAVLRG